jgi:hypothetical protein
MEKEGMKCMMEGMSEYWSYMDPEIRKSVILCS